MSSQEAKDQVGPPRSIDEQAVAAYLAKNPDFFERHPELVARLRIPHATGKAVSLIEHQVAVLRRQLQTERRRLSHLIDRAKDFESLSARLHRLALRLIAARDLEHVKTVLYEMLREEFDAEAVTLKLFPVGSEKGAPDPLVTTFMDFVEREKSLCGTLSDESNSVLFGEESNAVKSVALIPVRTEERSGILAIGSCDPDRFAADMGTDLLDRLGEVVAQKLRMLHVEGG